MVVQAYGSHQQKRGLVVQAAKRVPLLNQPARLLNDGEIMAYAIKRWAASGLVPPVEIELHVVLAVGRTLARR